MAQPVGDLLREWRQRRRMSQLDLASEAEISTRHLSFLETGRAQPSRDMVLHLAEQLEVPLRERNVLLVAAGFAPVFAERSLEDPALQSARKAVDLVLAGHEPYPALAVDRHWTLIAANGAVGRIIGGADASLLQPPVNVLRLSLHPKGLAPRIVNLPEWRAHLLARLRRWPWKPSSPPTPPPPKRSAASLERPAECCCGLRCRLVASIHHEHRCEHFEQNGTGDLNAR